MINLGDAGQQKEMASGPIPKGSMVKVRLEIRKPKKQDPQDPAISVFSSGLKGLDCEMSVIAGRFERAKIWENWFLPPQMQTISLTKGQEGICNGSFAKCRAIIEASRRLDPEDPAANRNINSWFDLHGLEFPVKVGVNNPKPGDLYINNNVLKVLTVKDAEYEQVMGGGEIVTDVPFPEIPKATDTTTTKAGGGWGQGSGQAAAGQQSQGQPAEQKKVSTPAWAQ